MLIDLAETSCLWCADLSLYLVLLYLLVFIMFVCAQNIWALVIHKPMFLFRFHILFISCKISHTFDKWQTQQNVIGWVWPPPCYCVTGNARLGWLTHMRVCSPGGISTNRSGCLKKKKGEEKCTPTHSPVHTQRLSRYDWQANTQVSDETCFDVGLWTDWKWNSALT